MKIKIGQTFLYKKSGDHNFAVLVVLYKNKQTGERCLFSPENNICYGPACIMYSKIGEICNKDDIKKYTEQMQKKLNNTGGDVRG